MAEVLANAIVIIRQYTNFFKSTGCTSKTYTLYNYSSIKNKILHIHTHTHTQNIKSWKTKKGWGAVQVKGHYTDTTTKHNKWSLQSVDRVLKKMKWKAVG